MSTSISVCIPTYRRPEALAVALRSVREQSLTHSLEVIVRDNADQGKEAAEAYGARYLRNEENVGARENLRRLVNDASGAVVCTFCDDERFTDPLALQKLTDRLVQSEDVSLATAAFAIEDSTIQSMVHAVVRQCRWQTNEVSSTEFIRALLLGKFEHAVSLSATVYRREDAIAVGAYCNPALHFSCDVEFLAKLASRRASVGFVEDTLLTNYTSSDSTSVHFDGASIAELVTEKSACFRSITEYLRAHPGCYLGDPDALAREVMRKFHSGVPRFVLSRRRLNRCSRKEALREIGRSLARTPNVGAIPMAVLSVLPATMLVWLRSVRDAVSGNPT